MKEIWFIRHAESEGNAGMPTSSTQDNPLSEKGLKQADDLTTYLYFSDDPDLKPDLIVHSKFKRTIQTMKPMADSFPNIPVEEWNIHEFTYLCNEKYANTTENDRKHAKHAYWDKCEPYYVDGKGSESFIEFRLRTRETIEKAFMRDADLIYIYSHGWFIKMVWWTLQNGGFRDVSWNKDSMSEVYKFFESIPFPNTGILKVSIQDDGSVWLNTWELSHDKETRRNP